jgi:hypothetical protein
LLRFKNHARVKENLMFLFIAKTTNFQNKNKSNDLLQPPISIPTVTLISLDVRLLISMNMTTLISTNNYSAGTWIILACIIYR